MAIWTAQDPISMKIESNPLFLILIKEVITRQFDKHAEDFAQRYHSNYSTENRSK